MLVDESKPYQVTKAKRTANAVVAGFLKFGLGLPETHLLTTRGNKSGFLRTTPVDLIENAQGRFLVAPYGLVGWVRNIRADGFATLRRGGWIELISVEEVAAQRAAPVLREYLDHPRALVLGSHFSIAADASLEAFAAEAPKHPVFEIVRSTTIRI